MSYTVRLPWPSADLSPNARRHWAVKAKAAKSARSIGYFAAHDAKLPKSGWPETVSFIVTIYPPDRRHYDDDNLISRIKHQRDGIADAMGINDRAFRLGAVMWGPVVKGGSVRVEIVA